MNYFKKEHEKRIYVFDEVQKQKSAIVRIVLDLVEDLDPDISDEDLNEVRKVMFREVDRLHQEILNAKE